MNWFNLAISARIFGRRILPWNAFNRRSAEGHFWGLGILQIGRRHLAYVGHDQAWLGFVQVR